MAGGFKRGRVFLQSCSQAAARHTADNAGRSRNPIMHGSFPTFSSQTVSHQNGFPQFPQCFPTNKSLLCLVYGVYMENRFACGVWSGIGKTVETGSKTVISQQFYVQKPAVQRIRKPHSGFPHSKALPAKVFGRNMENIPCKSMWKPVLSAMTPVWPARPMQAYPIRVHVTLRLATVCVACQSHPAKL